MSANVSRARTKGQFLHGTILVNEIEVSADTNLTISCEWCDGEARTRAKHRVALCCAATGKYTALTDKSVVRRM